jgi:hypothetical protein
VLVEARHLVVELERRERGLGPQLGEVIHAVLQRLVPERRIDDRQSLGAHGHAASPGSWVMPIARFSQACPIAADRRGIRARLGGLMR